jgi:hypothetical protein
MRAATFSASLPRDAIPQRYEAFAFAGGCCLVGYERRARLKMFRPISTLPLTGVDSCCRRT